MYIAWFGLNSKNGMVSFKEFLFAFTQCVGIDEGDDDEE